MNTIKSKVVLVALLFASCNHGKQKIQPHIKPLVEAVYASGYVVAQNEYEVFSQAEGYLSEKLVDDGQSIKKGDPLFILDSDQQSSRYQLARESFAMASRNHRDDSPVLKELTASLLTSKTKMEFDSVNFVRYSNLLKSNATSRSEFDRMKLTYENSKNDYILQRSRYQKMKDQLYLDLENAKSQLEIASNESGRYIVRSNVTGKVFKTMKDKGELVKKNELIAVVGNDRTFYLQLNVDELDIRRVKVGQDVAVKIDAYGERVFQATVSKIYPMVNQQQQSLHVDATLKEPLADAFTGLAVEANIIIRKKDNAMVIPKAALLPGDSVLVKNDRGDEKVKVVPGIETLDEVEVMSGISAEQTLLINQ